MNGGNLCDMSPLFNVAVRTESRSNMCMLDKRQFNSNLLLFTRSPAAKGGNPNISDIVFLP